MRTAVVILNWNTREHLQRWLPGLLESVDGCDAEVIVADNASTDGSAEYVQSRFPGVRLIRFESNLGFTGGYNRALGQIPEAEFFVLVNSDIEVRPGWLEPLEAWMDSNPGCAVCGPKIHAMDRTQDADGQMVYSRGSSFEYAGAAGGYIDHYGYPFCRGRVLSRTEEDFGQYDTPADVQWVSGACLMVRSSVWKELGGLDERFFAHMEEIDFCLRAIGRGWRVCVVPASTVWHLGGGTLPQSSPFKLKLNYRNSLLMMRKSMPGARVFVRMLLDGAAACAYLLQGRPGYFRAVWDAHREARKLKDSSKSDFVPGPMDRIRIIPLALLKGRKIFKYLKDYEDSHSRCR
ncbi:MAG: glycosyltransferase family 2 protein [Bacteroidales bacterium]|nr:glycosyltransferase family 2 protein [Bacteroidales bacterium]